MITRTPFMFMCLYVKYIKIDKDLKSLCKWGNIDYLPHQQPTTGRERKLDLAEKKKSRGKRRSQWGKNRSASWHCRLVVALEMIGDWPQDVTFRLFDSHFIFSFWSFSYITRFVIKQTLLLAAIWMRIAGKTGVDNIFIKLFFHL